MIGRVMPVHVTCTALILVAGVMGMSMIGNLGSELGVPLGLGLGREHRDRAVAERRVGDGQQHRRRRQAEHYQRQ